MEQTVKEGSPLHPWKFMRAQMFSLDQRARLYLQSLPENGICWTGWHDHGRRDPAGRF